MNAKLLIVVAGVVLLGPAAAVAAPCRIGIFDRESGQPVPLVELRTTHELRLVSDNAGLIALDDPELMGREVWFHVIGHGYEVARDGFGYSGVRLTPQPGATLRVEVERKIIARRLGRWTGAGLFAHARKLGVEVPAEPPGIHGCDSVLMARHGDRLFWLWGDTTLPRYPLGVFHSTAATSPSGPLVSFEPPLAPPFEHFRDDDGTPSAVAPIEGPGPTWLGGMISVVDGAGNPRLVATYSKIKPPLDEYEIGLCVWNGDTRKFATHKTLWQAERDGATKPPVPRGHPVRWRDSEGADWILFGDPFPVLRMRDSFDSWGDPKSWQVVAEPAAPRSAADGSEVKPHRGSVSWNPFRQRWVAVFTQHFGKPSAFGEIWYAEADSPLGPWGPAVKVLSHDNYTFYNPRVHPELVPADASFLVFEGTYTAEFANHARPTPRHNYNQVLYRLDLDDPRLEPARK